MNNSLFRRSQNNIEENNVIKEIIPNYTTSVNKSDPFLTDPQMLLMYSSMNSSTQSLLLPNHEINHKYNNATTNNINSNNSNQVKSSLTSLNSAKSTISHNTNNTHSNNNDNIFNTASTTNTDDNNNNSNKTINISAIDKRIQDLHNYIEKRR